MKWRVVRAELEEFSFSSSSNSLELIRLQHQPVWGCEWGFSIIAGFSSLFVVTISHQNVCLVQIKYLYLLLCSQVCCILCEQNHYPFLYFYKGEAWCRRGSCSVTMFENRSRYIHEGMCLFAWLFFKSSKWRIGGMHYEIFKTLLIYEIDR